MEKKTLHSQILNVEVFKLNCQLDKNKNVSQRAISEVVEEKQLNSPVAPLKFPVGFFRLSEKFSSLAESKLYSFVITTQIVTQTLYYFFYL